MKEIKKFLGLISVVILFTSTILGTIISRSKEEKLASTSSRSAEQRDFSIVSLPPITEIETKQPQYICLEDFLEIDENTLISETYNSIEVVECMGVGCGAVF